MFAKSWLLLLILCFISSGVNAEKGSRVLLLNSYHPQFSWTAKLTQGVQDTLEKHVPTENLHIEFMDERRFKKDATITQNYLELLQHKYQDDPPDVVITSDDYAYYFLVAHGEKLFPGVPVVFCGVNVFNPETLTGKTNFTGIKEGMEIEGNLNLIMALQPNTQRIIMLGDTTGLGLRMVAWAKHIKSRWEKHSPQVTLSIWDDFTLDELYERVAKLDSNTVLLMLAIHQDNQGNYFSFNRELPLLSARSAVPIYGMWGELMLGQGVVGGRMNNPYQHGARAAAMALKIVNGVPVANLLIQEKAQYSPNFDFAQLSRFNIDVSRLPANSHVINRPKDLHEKFRQLLFNGLGLLLLLALALALLMINLKLRRKHKENSGQFNSQLQMRASELDEHNQALQATSRKMEKLAHTDELTGLANRRAGESEVNAHLRRVEISGQPLSLAFLDIDHFKSINDNFGHPVGDDVLCALGMGLTKALRPGDKVYRWGGEEFLILLPYTNIIDAQEVCERVRHGVSELVIGNWPPVSEIVVTASLGLSAFKPSDSLDDILKRCDEALYQAKHGGRNQLVVA